MKKSEFEYILQLLKQQAGWDFDEDKYFVIDKKIYTFSREKGYASVEALIADLKNGNKTLIEETVEALVMSDTSFFRDYAVFRGFEKYLIPHLKESNRGVKKLRVWSVGCAAGQEAYSIAFMLNKYFPKENDWDVDIIGTDLSTNAIAKAQKGLYTSFEVQMGMNARVLLDNFTPEDDMWKVNPDIKRLVEFRKYNVLESTTFSEKFDVIFCRNLLRFFDKDTQKQIIDKIYANQIREGFLYIGAEEEIGPLDEYYEPVKGVPCLYQSKNKDKLKSFKPRGDKEDVMPSFSRPKVKIAAGDALRRGGDARGDE